MTETFDVRLAGVTKEFGEITAVSNIDLNIRAGEFFSLLGPSGCGKTTTLRMIAGFEQPTMGDIFIKGQQVAGVPAYKRPVNTVFQSYALFPHMTVAENIAFGLQMKKVSKDEIAKRVSDVLELVQLPQLAERKPKQLSGGQQQRIALARALVNRPQVLLLDEPLGALDLKLRKAMQLELKQIQSEVGITFIYVTHDQEEALTMSDRIAVMSDGLVKQVGAPREIYEHPANRFVADFIGETNFVNGNITAVSNFITVDIGGVRAMGSSDGRSLSENQAVSIAIRPEKVSLYPQGEVSLSNAGLDAEEIAVIIGSQPTMKTIDMRDYLMAEKDSVVLNGRVTETIYIGTDTRYRVELEGGEKLIVRVQNYGSRYDADFAVDDNVYVHWAAENAQILTE